MKHLRSAAAAVAVCGALLLASCSPPSSGSAGSARQAIPADKTVKVGFFGFSKSNGFALGTFKGVEEAAAANNATATFVDPNFDAQKQIQQVQDAVTSKQFDVIVIQANDNQALVGPLTKAVEAGITVVIEYSIVGPKFDTIQPQISGAISIVDLPGANGKALAKLGESACEKVTKPKCKVAYLEGFKSLPLDNVRTKAVLDELGTKSNIEVVASVEGGYTPDSGRKAFQDVIQSNPDVDVVIGASQAIAGAFSVAGTGSKIAWVGNGASDQTVAAVRSGAWFGVYYSNVVANGKKATELGINQARGITVETAVDEATLAPNNAIGTKEVFDKNNYVAGYSD